MSETLRIREAARVLHRQRPDDTREGSILASYSPPTAAEMADKYRELAQRAAMDLQRRIKGLEGLFGGEVAQPLDAAAEELREAFYAALDQHELARHITGAYVARLREQHAAELLRYRAYLGSARHQEARRRLRGGAERPAWYVKSEDLFYEDGPF